MKAVALFALVIVSSILFFGLAVLGLGGFSAVLSRPPVVALGAIGLLMMAAALFTSGNLSQGTREDKGNRWVIWAFAIIGLADGYLPALADARNFWIVGGGAVRWAGTALFTIGCVIRLAPVFVLGNRFSGLVAIQPGHRLVTGGLYSTIRHPSYLGMLLTVLGWGLAFDTWVGVLLAALTIPPVIGRIRAEERMLASEFGAEYETYRARTARLLPGLY